jgi:hypothetical protein
MTSQLFTPCFHVCQPDTYGSPPQLMKPADKIAGVFFRSCTVTIWRTSSVAIGPFGSSIVKPVAFGCSMLRKPDQKSIAGSSK